MLTTRQGRAASAAAQFLYAFCVRYFRSRSFVAVTAGLMLAASLTACTPPVTGYVEHYEREAANEQADATIAEFIETCAMQGNVAPAKCDGCLASVQAEYTYEEFKDFTERRSSGTVSDEEINRFASALANCL